MRKWILAAVAAMGLVDQAEAATVVLWDEAVDGDLPNEMSQRPVFHLPRVTEAITYIIFYSITDGDFDWIEARWGQSARAGYAGFDFSKMAGSGGLTAWGPRQAIFGFNFDNVQSWQFPASGEIRFTLEVNPDPPKAPLPATAPLLLAGLGLIAVRIPKRGAS